MHAPVVNGVDFTLGTRHGAAEMLQKKCSLSDASIIPRASKENIGSTKGKCVRKDTAIHGEPPAAVQAVRDPVIDMDTHTATANAPVARAPASCAPTSRAPTSRAPASRAPASRAPASRARAPVVNAPVANAPTINALAANAPVVNAPAANALVANAPAANAPIANTAAVNVPLAYIPAADAAPSPAQARPRSPDILLLPPELVDAPAIIQEGQSRARQVWRTEETTWLLQTILEEDSPVWKKVQNNNAKVWEEVSSASTQYTICLTPHV